jgi:hypothetical protein
LIITKQQSTDIGGSGGRDSGKEARSGWSIWEDTIPSFGTTIRKMNKKEAPKEFRRPCSHNGCTKQAHNEGVCITHGAKTNQCSHEVCTKQVVRGGMCKSHAHRFDGMQCSMYGMQGTMQSKAALLSVLNSPVPVTMEKERRIKPKDATF